MAKLSPGRSRAVLNSHETITGDFTRNPDMNFMGREMAEILRVAVGDRSAGFIEASRLATALLGDSIATNLFMLGFAWQQGMVPLSREALDAAIVLNGVAVEFNRRAFLWGRRAAVDPEAVARIAAPAVPLRLQEHSHATSLEDIVTLRIRQLTAYQNAAYARRYKDLVVRVQRAEAERARGASGLAETVARYYFKLLAYKDEYEVARLYTDGAFLKAVRDQFEGDYTLKLHLAPPLFAKRDPATGELQKQEFGPWMLKAFGLLASLKGLRGTPFDPFGYTAERRQERQLIAEYEAVMAELLAGLNSDNHALAVAIAAIPEHIRGYGHVKEAHLAKARTEQDALLRAFRDPDAPRAMAAQ
jgi:indolepyruvate ferredoxin oxidoreductase